WHEKFRLAVWLMTNLGSLASPLGLLALAALAGRHRWLALAAVALGGTLILAGYGLVAWLPFDLRAWTQGSLSTAASVFGLLGALLVSVLGGMTAALWWQAWRGRSPLPWAGARAELFLIGWAGLEVAGHSFLTPFPAARRTLGVIVVLALLAGRMAS